VNEQDLEKVKREFPDLTGHGVCQKFRPVEITDINLGRCGLACEWIQSRCEKTKTIRPVSSYGLKHVMENQTTTYVTNGEFIAAAVHLGYRVKRHHMSINVSFNMRVK